MLDSCFRRKCEEEQSLSGDNWLLIQHQPGGINQCLYITDNAFALEWDLQMVSLKKKKGNCCNIEIKEKQKLPLNFCFRNVASSAGCYHAVALRDVTREGSFVTPRVVTGRRHIWTRGWSLGRSQGWVSP